jgi:hypothetical protein
MAALALGKTVKPINAARNIAVNGPTRGIGAKGNRHPGQTRNRGAKYLTGNELISFFLRKPHLPGRQVPGHGLPGGQIPGKVGSNHCI